MNRLTKRLLVVIAAIALPAVIAVLSAAPAYAASITPVIPDANPAGTVPGGGAGPSDDYKVDVTPLPKTTATPEKVQTVLGIVFSIIGALSLLMVVIGGFRYIASQGDPQAASRAKGTIMYALIGLVVSISAVAIVTFVIGKV